MIEHRLHRFDELLLGFVGRHAANAAAAGDADVLGANFRREVERRFDHRRAVGAILRVRADQAGFEIWFRRGVFPIAE